MNAVINKIPPLVDEELSAANAIHKSFHNHHEGYAVLLEEVEEAHAELIDVEANLKQLWDGVRRDYPRKAVSFAENVEYHAVRLAAEAIQVAAMARKFRGSDVSTLYTTEGRMP